MPIQYMQYTKQGLISIPRIPCGGKDMMMMMMMMMMEMMMMMVMMRRMMMMMIMMIMMIIYAKLVDAAFQAF